LTRAELKELPRNSRVLGVGPTGSGKSVLFRALLMAQRHAIIVDSKHGWNWETGDLRYSRFAYSIRELVNHLRAIEEAGTGDPVVYRPRRVTFADFDRGIGVFQRERNRDLNQLWAIALERGNTLVYHDEISLDVSASTFESTAPMWRELVITGRWRGVGMWCGSQRPQRIPLIASTEASDRFAFFLREKTDQERADHFCGGSVPWGVLAKHPHSFVWADDETMHSTTPLQPQRLNLLIGKEAIA
jgi:energy-coupling factor transporter ATP-binding protein EcfA2